MEDLRKFLPFRFCQDPQRYLGGRYQDDLDDVTLLTIRLTYREVTFPRFFARALARAWRN